ncbi:LON peptidase substrate-binding domain-containing protein [Mucisphaera calidilacus]|uniref:Lon protease 2 n=1 Tax=Mucisphaera calidilacus TaxID=2527982 RepID=A0A518BVJ0_9BACT|nr:LON peptidase substrate-binding domain-containing protein [Mucisphaera calidilacus]QDU70967.1 Lon protease 2 [Mucisphaera calidilacus]
MTEESQINFERPIPLFPLASCVLLPHATIRLHIFEHRYRAMVADALETDRHIAMAVFNDPRWKESYEGNPTLQPAVCVGRIIRETKLPDGRYNLLLQGRARAAITEEHPHEPYRIATLEPLETDAPLEIDLEASRQRIDQLLQDPNLGELASVQAVRNCLCNDVPTSVLVDLAALTICQEPAARYALLAQPDPALRVKWLIHHLQSLRDTVIKAHRCSTGDPDAFIYLN